MTFNPNLFQPSRRTVLRASGAGLLGLTLPHDLAAQLQNVASLRVLVPSDSETAEEEDEAWARLTEREFFRGYAESDSIYDDSLAR